MLNIHTFLHHYLRDDPEALRNLVVLQPDECLTNKLDCSALKCFQRSKLPTTKDDLEVLAHSDQIGYTAHGLDSVTGCNTRHQILVQSPLHKRTCLHIAAGLGATFVLTCADCIDTIASSDPLCEGLPYLASAYP